MKVFAEFITEDGIQYRRTTLLQFGNTCELIGSAVLINPGSAEPIGTPNVETIKKFYLNEHKLDTIDMGIWKTFSVDSTMWQLEKIFNGWYVGKPKELSGIIQLFNCFYYKSQDLDNAIENFNPESSFNFNEYDLFNKKPVYFGWGNTGKHKKLKQIALNIFSNYDLKMTPVYDSEFDKNPFYHPGYVNRSYNRSMKTKELMTNFEKVVIQKN